MLVAILRIVIPLLIIFVIVRVVIPRIRRSQTRQSDRIEVEAEVVSSKPHTPPEEAPPTPKNNNQ